MTGRIDLEQFVDAPGRSPEPTLDLAMETDLSPALPAEPLPDAGATDLPPMGEPMIRRAVEPEEDPETHETERLAEELSHACARLADVIAAIESERAAMLDATTRELSDAIAAAGAELLSSLIDQGMAGEIAAAIADIAARIPHARADLHVAAGDHEALARAIAAHAPAGTITLVSDPALATGQARMVWPDGGAELDAADLTGRIAPLIAERLNTRSTQ